ncbi:MAG: hypothetical protein KGO50_17955, partial [Myxococcales bacterium]|nr:hypothetical protein [Myxococcales bacterium]
MAIVIDEYLRALRENPNDLEVVAAMDRALTHGQDWSTLALALPDAAVGLTDAAHRARFLLRAAWVAQEYNQDAEHARALFIQVVGLDLPDDSLVGAFQMAFSPDQDWSGLTRAYVLFCDYASGEATRARLMYAAGRVFETRLFDKAQAIAAYQKAFRLDPHFTDSLHAARSIYAQEEQWGTVVKLFQVELKIPREDRLRARLLREMAQVQLARLGDATAGLENLKQSLALDPSQAGVREQIASLGGDVPEVDPEILATEPEVAVIEPDVEAAAEPEEAVPAEPDVEAAAEPEEEAAAEPEVEAAAEPEEAAAAEPAEAAAAEPEVEAAAEPGVEAASAESTPAASPATGVSVPVAGAAARVVSPIADGVANYLGADDSAREWVLGLVDLAPTQSGDAALKTWSAAIEFGRKLGFGPSDLASWTVDAVRGSMDGIAAVQALMPSLYGHADVWRAVAEQLDVALEGDSALTQAAYAVHFYALSDGARASELAPLAGAAAALEQTLAAFAVKGNWRKTQTGLQEALAARYGSEAET